MGIIPLSFVFISFPSLKQKARSHKIWLENLSKILLALLMFLFCVSQNQANVLKTSFKKKKSVDSFYGIFVLDNTLNKQ